jgi:hypothetical protein
VQQYKAEDVHVEQDPETGMLVAEVNGHQAFFPKSATPTGVRQSVCITKMEQIPRSPPCYLGSEFTAEERDMAVLAGASDGVSCLILVNKLPKAYLFEPNPYWISPLQTTLKPWSDKVEVVPLALAAEMPTARLAWTVSCATKPSQTSSRLMWTEPSRMC